VLIPGNLLSEGTVLVAAGLITLSPVDRREFWCSQAVAFRVYDTMQPDSARGDFTGHMAGIVRPLLNWTTSARMEPTGFDRDEPNPAS
jgi:hypothetical protein